MEERERLLERHDPLLDAVTAVVDDDVDVWGTVTEDCPDAWLSWSSMSIEIPSVFS